MTREKVIEGLETALAVSNVVVGTDYVVVKIGEVKKVLELLKEQEPKQVVMTTNSYGTKFYHCPRCNHDIYAYPRQMYCSQCGKAVKWE